jgi:hypothetical protein
VKFQALNLNFHPLNLNFEALGLKIDELSWATSQSRFLSKLKKDAGGHPFGLTKLFIFN